MIDAIQDYVKENPKHGFDKLYPALIMVARLGTRSKVSCIKGVRRVAGMTWTR